MSANRGEAELLPENRNRKLKESRTAGRNQKQKTESKAVTAARKQKTDTENRKKAELQAETGCRQVRCYRISRKNDRRQICFVR